MASDVTHRLGDDDDNYGVCFLFSVSRIRITLAVDKVSMQLIDGRLVSFYVEKERLLRILRHQVIHQTCDDCIYFRLENNCNVLCCF